MLANCVFADRILSEYGVRDLVERGLVRNGLISTGFCLCFVNNIFSDNSDFICFAKLPSYEELHPPMRPLLDAVCASRARAGLRGVLRRLFQGRFGGFPREGFLLGGCDSLLGSFASRRS